MINFYYAKKKRNKKIDKKHNKKNLNKQNKKKKCYYNNYKRKSVGNIKLSFFILHEIRDLF